MKWFWYSSKSDEIFLDIDSFEKCRSHIERRLNGAIEYARLDVRRIIEFPSVTPGHRHWIIQLNSGMRARERAIWAIILHSDIYRGCSTLMRIENDVQNPDILISPYQSQIRRPDAFCECESKHTMKVMQTCPAAFQMRKENRAQGFFGKPSDNEADVKIIRA